jgi:hypothetical protein
MLYAMSLALAECCAGFQEGEVGVGSLYGSCMR